MSQDASAALKIELGRVTVHRAFDQRHKRFVSTKDQKRKIHRQLLFGQNQKKKTQSSQNELSISQNEFNIKNVEITICMCSNIFSSNLPYFYS